MKTIATCLAVLAGGLALYSCSDADARYIDLETGEPVNLYKDAETGRMVRSEGGEPIEIYVDTRTRDTIYGPTGEVVNGKLKMKEGKYKFEPGDDNERGEVKVERESSGDYSAKYGDDVKIKYDDGEYKEKRPGYKKEIEKDGDVTIKTKGKKIKIDGETGERKVKYED